MQNTKVPTIVQTPIPAFAPPPSPEPSLHALIAVESADADITHHNRESRLLILRLRFQLCCKANRMIDQAFEREPCCKTLGPTNTYMELANEALSHLEARYAPKATINVLPCHVAHHSVLHRSFVRKLVSEFGHNPRPCLWRL